MTRATTSDNTDRTVDPDRPMPHRPMPHRVTVVELVATLSAEYPEVSEAISDAIAELASRGRDDR